MFLIILMAFLGAIAHGLLAWSDSQKPFNSRSFTRTLITAIAAGLTFGAGYTMFGVDPEIKDYILAFLSGYTGNAVRSSLKAL